MDAGDEGFVDVTGTISSQLLDVSERVFDE